MFDNRVFGDPGMDENPTGDQCGQLILAGCKFASSTSIGYGKIAIDGFLRDSRAILWKGVELVRGR
jgi:hypothetical protein